VEKSKPTSARRRLNSAVSNPPVTPTSKGVPTAPNVTGVLWTIKPIITAAIAGKPKTTNKGPTIAAGVPKPEAPSPLSVTWLGSSFPFCVQIDL